MEKKLKALRVAALLGAVSGASVLLAGFSVSAQAGEERLHSASFKVYGLIPAGESKAGANSGSSLHASTDTTTSTMNVKSNAKRGSSAPGNTADNEPKLEDPPMPSYDGPNGGGNTMASNDTGGQVSNN